MTLDTLKGLREEQLKVVQQTQNKLIALDGAIQVLDALIKMEEANEKEKRDGV